MKRGSRTLLVAHPSPDLYGSDRQLLESITAAVDDGWSVSVVLPEDGPLARLLPERGARVQVVPFPVLRKSLASLPGLARLAAEVPVSFIRMVRLLRHARPTALYVNTVTIPLWLAAARVTRIPALCHVHEAEESQPRAVRTAMVEPLRLARQIITNSEAARRALTDVVPALDAKIETIHNGLPGPPEEPLPAALGQGRTRVALVGRLSPRKGTDVALEATALLLSRGNDVELEIYGSVFPGYEWYEDELRTRAARDDLRGHVHFHGYVHPTWPALAAAGVVVVPSRVEPFGNTAAEALLARRPVIASDVQGLAEVIRAGTTGLLVPADDPPALADAVAGLLDDPDRAAQLAKAGLADARDRFSPDRYRRRICRVLDGLTPRARF